MSTTTKKPEAASKYYPAEDVAVKKLTRKTQHAWKPRSSLQAGQVLILLAGRYRGKRVVLLDTLAEGVLLVTGPFKVNGVPLRRVNSRYVIATTTKISLSGLDAATLKKVSGEKYFARDRKADKKGSEESFFGDKKEKKEVSKDRAEDQKKIDTALLSVIKKEPLLQNYLASQFSLRKGDKPHEMAF